VIQKEADTLLVPQSEVDVSVGHCIAHVLSEGLFLSVR
jgi:hypothetical protein